MALVKINWQPDEKTLREFSEYWMFFLGMGAMPLALYRGHVAAAVALWTLAVVGRIVGAWRPQWLRPVFLGLTLLTWPIGWTVSHLAMAIVYYGVLTPVGLVFRLMGRDALQRRLDREATTYWEEYRPERDRARYLKQF